MTDVDRVETLERRCTQLEEIAEQLETDVSRSLTGQRRFSLLWRTDVF